MNFALERLAGALYSIRKIIIPSLVTFLAPWFVLRILLPGLDNGLALQANKLAQQNSNVADAAVLVALLGNILWIIVIILVSLFARSTRVPSLIATLALAVTMAIGSVEGLKIFFNVPRPFTVLTEIQVFGDTPVNPAFPSGHTVRAAVVASVLTPLNTRFGLLLWTLALATGVSMMIRGVHYLSDILAALPLAYLIASFSTKIFRPPR